MPQIIVTADSCEGSAVMLRERINVTDFESEHFAAQLVERINWAVEDADELEHGDHRDHREPGEPGVHGVHGETDGSAGQQAAIHRHRDLELAH